MSKAKSTQSSSKDVASFYLEPALWSQGDQLNNAVSPEKPPALSVVHESCSPPYAPSKEGQFRHQTTLASQIPRSASSKRVIVQFSEGIKSPTFKRRSGLSKPPENQSTVHQKVSKL